MKLMILLKFTTPVAPIFPNILVLTLLSHLECCDSRAEGPQNEYACMPENQELNKPRFRAVLIIGVKNHEREKKKERRAMQRGREAGKKSEKVRVEGGLKREISNRGSPIL